MCTTIFYHANCLDGSTAALAAWLALGDEHVRYRPLAYGAPLPTDIEAGTDVYFLDVTPSRQVLLDLAKVAGRITVIDHHTSAQAALAGLTEQAANTLGACWIRTTFDLDHSGAVLAWNHWHPDQPAPRLFTLVEDRDLWRFHLPESKPLHYALERLEHSENPRVLAEYITHPDTLGIAIDFGRVIHQYLTAQWTQIARRASDRLCWPHGPLDERLAPRYRLINCPPMWFSDVGHHILEAHPDIDLAILYHDTRGTERRTYSLRSRPNGPDCARLAAQLGGGGHPNAAGFTLPIRTDAYTDLLMAEHITHRRHQEAA